MNGISNKQTSNRRDGVISNLFRDNNYFNDGMCSDMNGKRLTRDGYRLRQNEIFDAIMCGDTYAGQAVRFGISPSQARDSFWTAIYRIYKEWPYPESKILKYYWYRMDLDALRENCIKLKEDFSIVNQTKITKSAKGEDCSIRIPGICNFQPETTVLAHLGGGGMGAKSEDYQGAYACYACHMAIDGHHKTDYTKEQLKLMHLEGVIETQQKLREKGLL